MSIRKSIAALGTLAMAATMFAAAPAHATTYSNTATNDIIYFGAPDTTSYGEVFSLASSATLQSWSFFFNGGSAGNLAYVVAAWDGSKAVGPALVTAAGSYAGGGAATETFSGLNTTLGAGDYIAYLTVAGVSSPVPGNIDVSGASDGGGLGEGFRFLNSNLVDPLTLSTAWSTWPFPRHDVLRHLRRQRRAGTRQRRPDAGRPGLHGLRGQAPQVDLGLISHRTA